MGVISALGPDLDSFRANIFAGEPGIRSLASIPPGALRFANGAQVQGYDPAKHFDPRQLSLLDPFAQYAVVAAREAVRRAALTIDPVRTAIVTGTGGGG